MKPIIQKISLCVFMLILVMAPTSCTEDIKNHAVTTYNHSDSPISLIRFFNNGPMNLKDLKGYSSLMYDQGLSLVTSGSYINFNIVFKKQDEELNSNYQIIVYAFKTSTLQRYTWEEIVEGNIYDAVLFMNAPELEKRNWTVIYPDDFELTDNKTNSNLNNP